MNDQKPKKPFNPTIARAFKNEKWGQGNYISTPINAEGYNEIQKHLQIGSRLLFKKSPVPAKESGEEYFFLELIPPFEGKQNQQSKKPAPRDEDI